jgi:putative transposase
VYHVINRGNGRATVFHKPGDYEAFCSLIEQACERVDMRVLGYCLMPNHFHLIVQPRRDGDLSRWMQWLMTAHVRRYHSHYQSSGHVWQGRFKAFPIEADDHLLVVLRYIERNALRAGLVERAEDWQWTSLRWLGKRARPSWLSELPVERPRRWRELVNAPQTDDEEQAMRHCIARSTPYGEAAWVKRIARRLGLESTLRPRGRPREETKK